MLISSLTAGLCLIVISGYIDIPYSYAHTKIYASQSHTAYSYIPHIMQVQWPIACMQHAIIIYMLHLKA